MTWEVFEELFHRVRSASYIFKMVRVKKRKVKSGSRKAVRKGRSASNKTKHSKIRKIKKWLASKKSKKKKR